MSDDLIPAQELSPFALLFRLATVVQNSVQPDGSLRIELKDEAGNFLALEIPCEQIQPFAKEFGLGVLGVVDQQRAKMGFPPP